MSAFWKTLISFGLGAFALIIVVPAFGLADTTCTWSPGGSNSASACTGGSLLVYVQTLSQDGNPHVSGDFVATISGTNPTPASVVGSLSGAFVGLGLGSYSVAISGNTFGYTPSYSQGCTGAVVNGQQQLCVITMSGSGSYGAVTPYPYPYNPGQQTLFCSSAYQTVNLGEPATFTATGGLPGQGSTGSYTWSTANKTFLNVGSQLSTVFPSTGTQTVTVTSGQQSATCVITVVAGGAPSVSYPQAPVSSYGVPAVYPGYTTAAGSAVAYISPTYIPALPNTGFEPQNGAVAAFAVVALLGAFGLSLPYVRKALAVVLG